MLGWGIELVEGAIGSGKSLYAVKMALEAMVVDKRPVYSNLPVKVPAIRRYLRVKMSGGNYTMTPLYCVRPEVRAALRGDQWANLYQPLTFEHMERFLRRVNAKREAKDRFEAERSKEGKPAYRAEFKRKFEEEHGPDITTGVDANWIPAGAKIIIDEAQHWFGQTTVGKDNRDLRGWLTMIRHHQQYVMVLTQERMQVSLHFRRLATVIVKVRNVGEQKLVWFFRWKHVGFSGAAQYTAWTPDGEKDAERRGGNASDDNPPIWAKFHVYGRPQMPWLPHRWRRPYFMFRLYRSVTHSESMRAQNKEIENIRREAGIELSSLQASKMERQTMAGFATKMSRRLVKVAAVCIIAAIAYGAGRGVGPRPKEITLERTWPALGSLGTEWARIGGQRVALGESVEGIELVEVDRAGRRVLVAADGGFWLWERSAEKPGYIGPAGELLAEVRESAGRARRTRVIDASGNTISGGEADLAPSPGERVGGG